MLVQVTGLTDSTDVEACLGVGVDHLGIVTGDTATPGGLPIEKSNELLAAIPDDHTTVALTRSESVETVLALANRVEPDILLVGADRMDLPPADLFDVREGLPEGMQLMRSIAVEGRGVVYPAMALDPIVDWLLLEPIEQAETQENPLMETDPWEICAEIVESVTTPCLLGGPLSPETVVERVQTVDPAGVSWSLETAGTEESVASEVLDAFVTTIWEGPSKQPSS